MTTVNVYKLLTPCEFVTLYAIRELLAAGNPAPSLASLHDLTGMSRDTLSRARRRLHEHGYYVGASIPQIRSKGRTYTREN